MIRVEHLTKKFVETTAVDDISFSVTKGEVVGFLGPNGAGKTTTMRMLTGFIPATKGVAIIDGHDVFTDCLPVRRIIGYLPENAPLYHDMRVNEYLTYRARLKKVKRHGLRKAVEAAMEKTSITDVGNRIIGHLSKGYKQRVGLADSLLNNPKILILDEPTIGLDPHQIRLVRNLIRELGKEHTIILSTHILPEVEATCSRVIIINKGKIAAEDTPKDLMKLYGKNILNLEIKGEPLKVQETLSKIDGVAGIFKKETISGTISRVSLEIDKDKDVRETVFQAVVANRWVLREMIMEKTTLEDIFVEITTEEKEEQD